MAVEQRRNGSTHGVLRIGDITTERRPVEINGRTHMGFVRGKGCPRRVEAEYRTAYQRYEDRLAERNETSKGAAYSRFVALLPDLHALAAAAVDEGGDSAAAYGHFLTLAPAILDLARALVRDNEPAWDQFLSDAVTVIVPALEEDYATVEAMNREQIFRIMRGLAWLGEEAEGVEDENPPATSETSETMLPLNVASPTSD